MWFTRKINSLQFFISALIEIYTLTIRPYYCFLGLGVMMCNANLAIL